MNDGSTTQLLCDLSQVTESVGTLAVIAKLRISVHA